MNDLSASILSDLRLIATPESALRLTSQRTFQRIGPADRGLSPRRAQHRPTPAPKKHERRRSAGSEQRRLRRRSRPKRGRRRRPVSSLPPVRENAFDELRLLDARDTQEPSAAARAPLDLDPEHALEAACLVHTNIFGRRALRRGDSLRCPRPSSCWRDRRSSRRVRREHSVKSRQMHPRRRHERCQPGNEVQRFHHDVRGSVAVRSLQPIAHLPLCREIESLDRHVTPRSLYLTQLRDRLGEAAVRSIAAPGQTA